MQDAAGAQNALSPLVSVLFRIFSAMNCGAILLDGNKRVLHLNERAQAHLGAALAISKNRLSARDRGCDALFQTMLDQSLGARERDWRREAVVLKREDKRPVIARAISVGAEAHNLLDGVAMVLLLVDPEDCHAPSYTLLQQVFGLTRGEVHLANQLLCGQSLQEIADANGLSIATVRSQTKAVFAKTYTHRQAELVGLLTRLAMLSESGTDEA
jgi:DNA-binding CsgD family transcriptional regulator